MSRRPSTQCLMLLSTLPWGSRGFPCCSGQWCAACTRGATTGLGSFGHDMAILRGVKQGDPLSPLLFNLVLNPVLARLTEAGDGFRVGTAEIAVTAYADDVALFSSSVKGLRRQLATVEEYLGSVGMSLSVDKCAGFAVEKRGDAWVAVSLGASPIRFVGVGEPLST